MGKRPFIRPLFAALALALPLQAIGRQPPCDLSSQKAPPAQDTSTCAAVRRGFLLISSNHSKSAEELFHVALTRATNEHDRFLQAHAHRGLSDALFLGSKYPAAKKEAEAALKIFVSLNDAKDIALMHDNLGLIAIQNGNRKLGSELMDEAYKEFAALGDDKGRLHVLIDQFQQAEESDAQTSARLELAASLARALHDGMALAQIEYRRGDMAFNDGDYAAALASYQRAVAFFKKAGATRQQAAAFTSLGRLYRELDDPPRARQCYRTALRLQEGARDLVGQVQSTNSIAVSFDTEKNWAEATRYYLRALALARKTGSPRVIRFAMGNLAGEYVESGKPALAVPILQKVIAEEDSPYLAAYRYQSLSKAYVALGRYDAALNAVNEAVHLRRESTNQSSLVDSLVQRAQVLSHLKNTAEGLKDTDEALRIVEAIRSRMVPNDFLKRGFGDAEQRIYDAAIQLQFAQGDFRSEAATMEAGRSRAFLDLLATRGGAAGPPSANSPKPPSATPLTSVAADSTDYAASSSAEDMAGFARKLQSTLISYWTSRDALYIVVVDPAGKFSGVRVKVGREELRHMIADTQDMHERLGSAAGNSSHDSWQKLYAVLIHPIQAYLPQKRGALLTIIPHGPLFRLPFCALRDSSGHYLVDRYATYYLPAAAVLRFTERSEQRIRSRKSRFLLVFYGGASLLRDSKSSSGNALPPLASAKAEVETIRSLFKSQTGTLLEGTHASAGAVAGAMEHSTMIHVASHGEFEEKHPLSSFLLLAPDPHGSTHALRQGHLTATEILELHIPADLVVLSACETSSGKITGDGVLGMTRAFFAAGAASVIATEWKIADKPSEWLMTRFYKNLLNGMSKADALRSAQLSLIAELRSGRLTVKTALGPLAIPEDPRFWAGFVLEGNP